MAFVTDFNDKFSQLRQDVESIMKTQQALKQTFMVGFKTVMNSHKNALDALNFFNVLLLVWET